MPLTLYGIPNCDTVKKARSWLLEQRVAYLFHDVRQQPLAAAQLKDWVQALGWDVLVNTRGTTWRQLPADRRENMDAASAVALLQEFPAVMKRPLLEGEGILMVGFDPSRYANRLAARVA